MQVQDFAQHYAQLSDDELAQLAAVTEQLTDEAKIALQAEMRARGLNAQDRINYFRAVEEERQRQKANAHAPFVIFAPWGIGHMRFGMAGRKIDPVSQLEVFTSTAFFILFWIPLIPTGTYRILSKRGRFLSRQYKGIERLPLDWSQVRRVWAITALCIAVIPALVLAIKFVQFLKQF